MKKPNTWRTRLRACCRVTKSTRARTEPTDHICDGSPKVLVLVEGPNDIHFLRHISAILHTFDPTLPDLADMERRRELIFVPFGGGDLRLWTFRLAGLVPCEFHLYDRDTPPETESRQQAVDLVNLRPGCRAVLTGKRSLENYLHREAIAEVGGMDVRFSDGDHVAELIARHCYDRHPDYMPWTELPARTRKRRRDKVKKWLNTKAVQQMTPERIAECDPDGEIASWLVTIARLADGIG